MRKLLLIFLFVSGLMVQASAQDRTVSGKVTSSEDDSTLPGVTVVLKGTTTGTTTDLDGNYKLSVPSEGGILVYSFVGMSTQEVEIGSRSVIDLGMDSDAQQLTEVVVTALGISREKRSLGYAVSSVDGKAIASKPSSDVGRLLNGKVTGVNITPVGGLAGQGTNIVIRGYTSLNLSNQPLFIVDGVPFNTGTNNQSGFTGGALNTPSRFLDLDPNNIASMEVLKGLSATVLYGQQGRNGVILITTKGAANDDTKFSVTFNQSLFFSEMASIPDYQNTYGNGFHQFPAFYFSNWGDKVANVDQVPHPYSQFSDPTLIAAFPQFQGEMYDYKAYDNVEKFFQRGVTTTSSLALQGSSGGTSFNAAFGYTKEEGFVPENELEKFNFSVGVNSKLTDKLTISTTLNMAITDVKAPPLGASTGSSASGNGSALFANVLYTPRTVDLNGLPFEDPLTGRSVYYRSGNDIPNPNWLVKYTGATSSTNRVFGRTQLTYDIMEGLSFSVRTGIDTYSEAQEYFVNKGIGSGPANDALNTGLYRTTYIKNTIWDNTALFTYNKDLSSKVNLGALLGFNSRTDKFDRDGIESTGQVAFGFLEHSNFTNNSSINSFTGTDIQFRQKENLYAVYGQINVDYGEFLYLNLTARNDWSSTVESANQSIIYPGASLAFIPTTAFSGLESNALQYLKLRLGYGTSAGFPRPYGTRNTLSSTARAFVDNSGNVITTNATSSILGNPNLGPELVKELEFGIEAKGFNNRVGLDMSFYKKNSTNLITNVPLDPSTGFTRTNANIGEIQNKGIELALNFTPVKSGDLQWDINFNFTKNISEVISLPDGQDVIEYAGFTEFAANALIEGEAYGVIRGTTTLRSPDGDRVVDASGNYIEANDLAILGDPNPEFMLTTISSLTWKGFRLGLQFDYRKGGDIFSITAAALPGRGLTTDVDFDREPTVILPGVKQDGTDGDGNPVYVENDIQITTTDAWFNNYGFGPGEFRVFDGTTIRLREISLGYSLPRAILDKSPLTGLSLTFSGQNLFYNAVNFPPGVNFDPEVMGTGVGNGQGLDFLSGPSAKKYGLSLKVSF